MRWPFGSLICANSTRTNAKALPPSLFAEHERNQHCACGMPIWNRPGKNRQGTLNCSRRSAYRVTFGCGWIAADRQHGWQAIRSDSDLSVRIMERIQFGNEFRAELG